MMLRVASAALGLLLATSAARADDRIYLLGNVPWATATVGGKVVIDGTTIAIDPVTHILSVVGGGTGCAISGAAGIVSNNGSNACITDTNATLSAGALTLGGSGTLGSITLGNATSGTVKLQPVAGALGTVTLSLPAATDTLVGLATADTLSNKTLVAPNIGAATGTSLSVSGQLTSTIATGTAPLVVSSTTQVANLNAATLGGATFAAPGAIGGGTAAAGTFTTLIGTGGSHTGITSLGLRDTSAAFDVTLAAVSSTALTAGRTLTLDLKNVAHTLAFGATANTITFPNTASYTLIGSGDSATVTSAMLAASLALTTPDIGAATGTSLTLTSNLSAGAAASILWTGRSIMRSGADGDIVLYNNATSSFTKLQFGGTSSSFPALKRNAAALNFRLADDSGDAAVTAASVNKVALTAPATSSTLTIADGKTLTDTSGIGAVLLKGATGGGFAAAAAADIPATMLATGTSVTLSAPREYYVCTGTCTATPPVPAAGYEFCVMNDDNVATVITLAAIGSSARYENTARTAYGTAGTGTFVSGGAAGDKACILGRDSTHYLTVSFVGTWTAN